MLHECHQNLQNVLVPTALLKTNRDTEVLLRREAEELVLHQLPHALLRFGRITADCDIQLHEYEFFSLRMSKNQVRALQVLAL